MLASLLIALLAVAARAESIDRFGLPDHGKVVPLTDFVLGYDGRLRSAAWTLELFERPRVVAVARDDSFFEDRQRPIEFRAKLRDYERSGYDRGHLAAAEDHRSSVAAQLDTFRLSNVSPQLASFNRGPWKQLEAAVRELSMAPNVRATWVATGPLFIPRDGRLAVATIGGSSVPVATHFFKSVIIARTDGTIGAATYVLPHVATPYGGSSLDAFAPFRVSIDDLEFWAGFDLWPALDAALEKTK